MKNNKHKQLVKDWYYLVDYKKSLYNMYIKGQASISTYMETQDESIKIQDKLFKILNEEYNIKHPYTSIPHDLEYVLDIIKKQEVK